MALQVHCSEVFLLQKVILNPFNGHLELQLLLLQNNQHKYAFYHIEIRFNFEFIHSRHQSDQMMDKYEAVVRDSTMWGWRGWGGLLIAERKVLFQLRASATTPEWI